MRLGLKKPGLVVALVALGISVAPWTRAADLGTAKFLTDRFTDATGALAVKGLDLVRKRVTVNIACSADEKLVKATAVTGAGSTPPKDLGSNAQRLSVSFDDVPIAIPTHARALCPRNKATPNMSFQATVTVEYQCKKANGQIYQKSVESKGEARVFCDPRAFVPAVAKQVMWKHACPLGYLLVGTNRSTHWSKTDGFSKPMRCQCEKSTSNPKDCKPSWPEKKAGQGQRG